MLAFSFSLHTKKDIANNWCYHIIWRLAIGSALLEDAPANHIPCLLQLTLWDLKQFQEIPPSIGTPLTYFYKSLKNSQNIHSNQLYKAIIDHNTLWPLNYLSLKAIFSWSATDKISPKSAPWFVFQKASHFKVLRASARIIILPSDLM